jgi:hypothetical protein
MAQHVDLRIDTGLQIYFCDPHSPWQRGTNENTNGLLRQYFPKGTDLSVHSADDIAAVALTLYSRPRKALGWKTPAETLDQYLRGAKRFVATTVLSPPSTLRSPSASAAAKPACDPRWARSAIASIMPCARVSLPRSSVNYLTATVSKPKARHAWQSGTTLIASTPRSTICRQSTMKGTIQPQLITAAQHRPPNRGNSKTTNRLRKTKRPVRSVSLGKVLSNEQRMDFIALRYMCIDPPRLSMLTG